MWKDTRIASALLIVPHQQPSTSSSAFFDGSYFRPFADLHLFIQTTESHTWVGHFGLLSALDLYSDGQAIGLILSELLINYILLICSPTQLEAKQLEFCFGLSSLWAGKTDLWHGSCFACNCLIILRTVLWWISSITIDDSIGWTWICVFDQQRATNNNNTTDEIGPRSSWAVDRELVIIVARSRFRNREIRGKISFHRRRRRWVPLNRLQLANYHFFSLGIIDADNLNLLPCWPGHWPPLASVPSLGLRATLVS